MSGFGGDAVIVIGRAGWPTAWDIGDVSITDPGEGAAEIR